LGGASFADVVRSPAGSGAYVVVPVLRPEPAIGPSGMSAECLAPHRGVPDVVRSPAGSGANVAVPVLRPEPVLGPSGMAAVCLAPHRGVPQVGSRRPKVIPAGRVPVWRPTGPKWWPPDPDCATSDSGDSHTCGSGGANSAGGVAATLPDQFVDVEFLPVDADLDLPDTWVSAQCRVASEALAAFAAAVNSHLGDAAALACGDPHLHATCASGTWTACVGHAPRVSLPERAVAPGPARQCSDADSLHVPGVARALGRLHVARRHVVAAWQIQRIADLEADLEASILALRAEADATADAG
jgi:hypothetical protein